MPDFLTAAGFEVPSLADLLDRTTAEQRAAIDPLFSNTEDTVIGMMNAIDASHEREAYEAIQAAFDAVNPDNAEDSLLDNVSAITGTFREPAKPSRFAGSRKLLVTLDPGAIVTEDLTVFSYTPQPSIRFVAKETVTNSGGVQAAFYVTAECETNGPIAINAGTVTTIATPSPGLISVTNPGDAIIGSNSEGNTALRRRRELELREQGATTPSSLKSDLLAYTNEDGEHSILSVEVLENLTDTTDANGLPPHSFEALVWDGPGAPTDDNDIAAIVEQNRPSGTPAVGSSGTTPPFSRPTVDEIEVFISLRKTGSAYVGDAAVATAIASASQTEQVPANGVSGVGVVACSVYASIVVELAGVNRVTLIGFRRVGDVSPPIAWTDFVIAVRHVAQIQSSNVTVSASEGL